jgi:membrane associated rhomboid family serine protease
MRHVCRAYLDAWGALLGQELIENPQQLFTSQFVHISFQHLLSNLLLLVSVSWQLEEKFGMLRIVVRLYLC